MSLETLFFALLGWVVGVLTNHAADVLPRQMGLATEPTCPQCGVPRPLFARSAVVGYLTGRRVCPGCGTLLSLRSVLVELVLPAIFVGLLWRYGLSVQLGLFCVYSVVLILVTVTDVEHRLIQHAVMVPALLVATVGAFFNYELSARRALLGGVAGMVLLLAMYGLARPISRLMGRLAGRPVDDTPFGFGDVTLGTFVGLITGLPGVFFALLITIVSAGAAALILVLVRSLVRRRYSMFTTMPYGPFLALGGFVVMVYGSHILQWYTHT